MYIYLSNAFVYSIVSIKTCVNIFSSFPYSTFLYLKVSLISTVFVSMVLCVNDDSLLCTDLEPTDVGTFAAKEGV